MSHFLWIHVGLNGFHRSKLCNYITEEFGGYRKFIENSVKNEHCAQFRVRLYNEIIVKSNEVTEIFQPKLLHLYEYNKSVRILSFGFFMIT